MARAILRNACGVWLWTVETLEQVSMIILRGFTPSGHAGMQSPHPLHCLAQVAEVSGMGTLSRIKPSTPATTCFGSACASPGAKGTTGQTATHLPQRVQAFRMSAQVWSTNRARGGEGSMTSKLMLSSRSEWAVAFRVLTGPKNQVNADRLKPVANLPASRLAKRSVTAAEWLRRSATPARFGRRLRSYRLTIRLASRSTCR